MKKIYILLFGFFNIIMLMLCIISQHYVVHHEFTIALAIWNYTGIIVCGLIGLLTLAWFVRRVFRK